MDISALRTFVTIAAEGNLTRAAERLCLSQPALSLQLRKLQDSIGLPLFERTARGMRLTDAGRHLLPVAERALTAAAEFRNVAAHLSGTVTGKLHVGTIVDPEFLRLGAFLKRLVEANPRLSTDLSHGMSGHVMREIEAGGLDVGFALGLPGLADLRERFHVQPLTPFTYRIIAPPGWAAQVRHGSWAELAAMPWIGTPPESIHNRLLQRIFEREGVVQNRVALVDQESSMLDLVKSGVGLSLCRDSIALHAAHTAGVTIADQVSVPAELGFICQRSRSAESAIAAAFKAIGEAWA